MINQIKYYKLLERIDTTFYTINMETGATEELALADMKANAKRKLATLCWDKSIGGFTYSGTFIRTDLETRSIIDQAINAIDLSIKTEPFNYKSTEGWVSLSRTDLINLATLMTGFVQGCYDQRKTLEDQIDTATTLSELQTILNSWT